MALYQALKEKSVERSHILIAGDFNQPDIDWSDNLSPSDPYHRATTFLESIRDCFLCQHVRDPTHFRVNQTPNTLDLVFTNEEDMLQEVQHEPPLGKSHHQLLIYNYQCYSEDKKPSAPKYNFNKGDYVRLSEILDEKNWQDLDRMSWLGAWEYLDGEINAAMAATIPLKKQTGTIRRRKPLWMNKNALQKLKKKQEAYKRYLTTREGKDYLDYCKARNQAKSRCRKAVRDF